MTATYIVRTAAGSYTVSAESEEQARAIAEKRLPAGESVISVMKMKKA